MAGGREESTGVCAIAAPRSAGLKSATQPYGKEGVYRFGRVPLSLRIMNSIEPPNPKKTMNLLSQLKDIFGGDRAIELYNQRNAARADDAPPLTLSDFHGHITDELDTAKAQTTAAISRAEKAERGLAQAIKRPALIRLTSGDNAAPTADNEKVAKRNRCLFCPAFRTLSTILWFFRPH